MDIDILLTKERILFDSSIKTKQQLFELAGQTLENQGVVTRSKKFIKALVKRETETSTGIEDGFGLPHGKSKCVKEPALLFIHSDQIADYRGLDGSAIEFCFVIAVPEKSNDLHLKILSSLSRKLMDNDFRTALKHADSPEEVLKILKS